MTTEQMRPMPPALPGMRGRPLHNVLAAEGRARLSAFWFQVQSECRRRLGDGRVVFVDLLARRGDETIACEVETTSRGVLVTAAKAGALGVPLWVLVPNRRVRGAVIRKLRRAGIGLREWRIKILTLPQLSRELGKCSPLFSPANGVGKNRRTMPLAPTKRVGCRRTGRGNPGGP